MTSAPKVTVKIGSLVLHGAAQAQRAPLVAALKAELARLLAAPGAIPGALVSAPARRAHVDAGSFTPASARGGVGGRTAAAATVDGRAIARAVHRSLTGGTIR